MRIAALEFRLQFQQGGDLRPWFGPVLRGGFGAILRSLSCGLRERSCPSCVLAPRCAYGYLFETPMLSEIEPGTVFHAPHPFYWKPPLLDEIKDPETVSLGLTLVGHALEYYPYFVLGLQQLGERGLGKDRLPFKILSIECKRTGSLLPSDRLLPEQSIFTLDPLQQCSASEDQTSKFRIIMKTPLRLRSKGQRLFHFNFYSLVSSVVRRVELLGKWHCDVDLLRRFTHLIELAPKVQLISDNSYFYDWTRYNKRQDQTMPIGGSLGEVTLEGQFGLFSGLFAAAEYIGAGNQTSFGLGQVKFEGVSNPS